MNGDMERISNANMVSSGERSMLGGHMGRVRTTIQINCLHRKGMSVKNPERNIETKSYSINSQATAGTKICTFLTDASVIIRY